MIDGKVQRGWGRCWVASNFFEILGGAVAHHPIPWEAPHPTGHLTFADAIERSCNVYFETLAYRLKVAGIHEWYTRFGLGRITGVGIPEAEGNLPDPASPMARYPAMACLAGIGQDQVLATPIQMANVAATIARGGIWMRPRLVPAGTEIPPPREPVATTNPSTKPSTQPSVIPDRVDLHLSKVGLTALRKGMINVVNARAGTGGTAKRDDMVVAGKTGSAQAALITYPQRDEVDRIVRDAKGRPDIKALLPVGTHANPRPDFPWYRATGSKETSRAHAWFIGYAPAENPKIAFAVMVEYGGSGGLAAGGVANRMLDACIKHGYLSPGKNLAKTE